MKVRLDFVTNSSSTSYVIAYKEKELPETQKELIEHNSDNVIKNEDELRQFLIEYYGYKDFEEMKKTGKWIKNKYDKYLNKIKAGYCIANLTVPYYDEEMMMHIENLEDGINVIILECE